MSVRKKSAFWISLVGLLACIVLIVCFCTDSSDRGQDLSFLNYKNAIPLIAQSDTAPTAIRATEGNVNIWPGAADSKALIEFLERARWTQRRAPASANEPPHGYIQFEIEENYTITVYAYPRLAAVCFGNDIRYYRTGAGDYDAARAAFIPAPSTVPDRETEPTRTDITSAGPVFSSGLAARGMAYGGKLVYISGDNVRALPLSGAGNSAMLIPLRTLRKQLPNMGEELDRSYFESFYLVGNQLVLDFNSQDEPISRFVAYDLTDGNAQFLCTTAKTYVWTILDERLFYLEHVSGLENADAQILRVLDLHTGEDREICPQVSAFGAAGGVIRYVSYAEQRYQVFAYDPDSGASSLLGAIPADLGKNCVFAFTADYITMGRFGADVWNNAYSTDKAKKLIVYTVNTGETAEYSLSSELQELVVCGRYAFIQSYNLTQDSRKSDTTAGLYRLDLSNGEKDWNPGLFLGGLYACTEETGLFWQYSGSYFSFGTLTATMYRAARRCGSEN